MKLRETVILMESEDYKERFRAEYLQVKIRKEKLDVMLKTHEAGTMPFSPTCSIEVLQKQSGTMGKYLDVLRERAEAENIDLDAPLPECDFMQAGTWQDPNLVAFWAGMKDLVREIMNQHTPTEMNVRTVAAAIGEIMSNIIIGIEKMGEKELEAWFEERMGGEKTVDQKESNQATE